MPWPQQLQPTGFHRCQPWLRQLLQPAGLHCCRAVLGQQPGLLLEQPLERPLVQQVVEQLQPTGFHCSSWAQQPWAARTSAWLTVTLPSLMKRRCQATSAAASPATAQMTAQFQRRPHFARHCPRCSSPDLPRSHLLGTSRNSFGLDARSDFDLLWMHAMLPNSASNILRRSR